MELIIENPDGLLWLRLLIAAFWLIFPFVFDTYLKNKGSAKVPKINTYTEDDILEMIKQ